MHLIKIIIPLLISTLLSGCLTTSASKQEKYDAYKARRALNDQKTAAWYEEAFPITELAFVPPFASFSRQIYTVKTEMGTFFSDQDNDCQGKQIRDTRVTYELIHLKNNEFEVTRTKSGCKGWSQKTYVGRMRNRTIGFLKKNQNEIHVAAITFPDDGRQASEGVFMLQADYNSLSQVTESVRNGIRVEGSDMVYVANIEATNSRSEAIYSTALLANLDSSDTTRLRQAALKARGGNLLGDVLQSLTSVLSTSAEVIAKDNVSKSAALRIGIKNNSQRNPSTNGIAASSTNKQGTDSKSNANRSGESDNGASGTESDICPYLLNQYYVDKAIMSEKIAARREATNFRNLNEAREFDAYRARLYDELYAKAKRECPDSDKPGSAVVE